jgi:hypothetical protein
MSQMTMPRLPQFPPYQGKTACQKVAFFTNYIAQREKQLARLNRGEEIWVSISISNPNGREVSKPAAEPASGVIGNAIIAIASSYTFREPKRQLTLEQATKDIQNWKKELAAAQDACEKELDVIVAEHGSLENKQRYDHQVNQRRMSIMKQARESAANKCKHLQTAHQALIIEHSKLRKATIERLKSEIPPLPISAPPALLTQNGKTYVYGYPKAGYDALPPEEKQKIASKNSADRAAFSKAQAANSKIYLNIWKTVDRDPAVVEIANKKLAAGRAYASCGKDEINRVTQELEKLAPIPVKGFSPCGALPPGTNIGREAAYSKSTKYQGIRGFGDATALVANLEKVRISGGGMPLRSFGPLPKTNLTCCSDGQWHKHEKGTFYTCPGSDTIGGRPAQMRDPRKVKKILGLSPKHLLMGAVCIAIVVAVMSR